MTQPKLTSERVRADPEGPGGQEPRKESSKKRGGSGLARVQRGAVG